MPSQTYELEMDDAGKSMLLKLRHLIRDVYQTLGKGYPEGVYQRALGVELQEQNIPYDMEVTMGIPYKNHIVGQVRADIILRGAVPVVIETKSTSSLLKTEERWQTSRYMKILNIPLGVLVNFTQSSQTEYPQIEFLVLSENEILLYDLDSSTAKNL
jgi:GxxExxY protein